MPSLHHYIGIAYSGAETPTSSLKGLRVYVADTQSRSRITVSASKPEAHAIKETRTISLFSELPPYFQRAFEEAE